MLSSVSSARLPTWQPAQPLETKSFSPDSEGKNVLDKRLKEKKSLTDVSDLEAAKERKDAKGKAKSTKPKPTVQKESSVFDAHLQKAASAFEATKKRPAPLLSPPPPGKSATPGRVVDLVSKPLTLKPINSPSLKPINSPSLKPFKSNESLDSGRASMDEDVDIRAMFGPDYQKLHKETARRIPVIVFPDGVKISAEERNLIIYKAVAAYSRQTSCHTSATYHAFMKMKVDIRNMKTALQEIRELVSKTPRPAAALSLEDEEELKRVQHAAGWPLKSMKAIKTFFDKKENYRLMKAFFCHEQYPSKTYATDVMERIVYGRMITNDQNRWPTQ